MVTLAMNWMFRNGLKLNGERILSLQCITVSTTVTPSQGRWNISNSTGSPFLD